MCFFRPIPYEEKKAIENSVNSELNKEKYYDSELKCMEGKLTKESSFAPNISNKGASLRTRLNSGFKEAKKTHKKKLCINRGWILIRIRIR
jgi:hypothetical protein